MSRKVLITGGAGFIGSHLAERLLASDDQILVIDNYATARRDSLAPHPNLTVIEGTIADAELVNQAFDRFRPEIVVHAAASYKDPNNWEEDARTNSLGTAIVVQASQRLKVRRLIYFQTALCYGLHPLEQPITLTHPIQSGASSYAISKTAGEYYVRLSDLDYLSFRLANVYGPRNLSGPLPTFYHRLISGKPCFVVDTRRDFIFVDDLIKVVMKALDGQGERGIYHVSSGSDYAIKELFDATVKALGIPLDGEVEVRPRNPDDAFTILLDPSKTNHDFDWQATTPLETGVRATVEWSRKYGVAQTYTHLKMEQAKV
jgi:UDP-glucose 4-epimerase